MLLILLMCCLPLPPSVSGGALGSTGTEVEPRRRRQSPCRVRGALPAVTMLTLARSQRITMQSEAELDGILDFLRTAERLNKERTRTGGLALAALVQRYSRELEESQPAPAVVPAVARPAVVQIPAPAVQTNGVAHPADGVVAPAVVPSGPSAAPAPTPAKPTAAPVQQPVDEGWFAYLMSWLLALWHLIF
jgi:hypothetical protein